MIEEKDIRITVRDGIKIAVRIYRPDGTGPFPTLLAASPYRYDNKALPPTPQFLWLYLKGLKTGHAAKPDVEYAVRNGGGEPGGIPSYRAGRTPIPRMN